MKNRLTLLESLMPRIKDRNAFENDRAFAEYIYQTIKEAMKVNMGKDRDIDGTTPVSMKVSPTSRVREIYESTDNLSDKQVKQIIEHGINIRKIQTSLCQRGTTADKWNLYFCWSLYEQGKSWNEIYELSDNNFAWLSEDPETIKRKLRRWKTRFNWQRKQA